MSHFYKPTGEPAHDGGLIQAKKEGHFPSVTTIIKVLNNEGINTYRVQQMMMAALTLPRGKKETDEQFMERLEMDARAHSYAAIDLGNIMHAAIQRYFFSGEFPEKWIPIPQRPVVPYLIEIFETHAITSPWTEVSFANHHMGFGGQVDLIAYSNGEPVIWDYKTQDAKTPLMSGAPKFKMYPEWGIQLAAYRHAVSQIEGFESFKTARCFTLAISTNPELPGAKVKQWPERNERAQDMKKAFRQFAALRSVYYEMHNLPTPPRIPITHSNNLELLNQAKVS